MAHDVLHMVCLGTHLSLVRFPSPVKELLELFLYTRKNLEFTHEALKKEFLPQLFGCLKPFLLPRSSNRNTLEF